MHHISEDYAMPPKPKFTKEQIIECAMQLVDDGGFEALSARELGRALGISSRPLYTVFESVDELKEELLQRIFDLYETYIMRMRENEDPFLTIGLNFIDFARDHTEFYRIIQSGARPKNSKAEADADLRAFAKICDIGVYAQLDGKDLMDFRNKIGIFSTGLADMLYLKRSARMSGDEIHRLLAQTGEALIRHALAKKTQSGKQ